MFVDKYTQAIIDLIAHGATPEDVCAEIGLCSAAIQSLQLEDDDSSEEEDSSRYTYSIAVFGSQTLKLILSQVSN